MTLYPLDCNAYARKNDFNRFSTESAEPPSLKSLRTKDHKEKSKNIYSSIKNTINSLNIILRIINPYKKYCYR
jgi:hypothetical protein